MKNEEKKYRPVWLQFGQTIFSAVVELFGKRLHKSQQSTQLKPSSLNIIPKKKESSSAKLLKRSKFELFGPKLNKMNLVPGANHNLYPCARAKEYFALRPIS